MRPSSRPALVGLLTARVIMFLAIGCVIGSAAGVLTYLALHSLPQALLAAGTATGGSSGLLKQLIGTGTEAQQRSEQ